MGLDSIAVDKIQKADEKFRRVCAGLEIAVAVNFAVSAEARLPCSSDLSCISPARPEMAGLLE